MNVLLVDDDIDVIEAIVAAVDFSSIGITRVLSATNAAKATEILESDTIDLMVTDIEMPNASGIDLLRWVRDKGMPTVTMFCTCYADFSYAQKAIKLNSFDYFLKPIAYDDFTRRLALAVEEARRIKDRSVYENYDQKVTEIEEEIRSDFWEKILLEREPFPIQLKKYPHLEYGMNEQYVLCISFLAENGPSISEWKRFAYHNIENELLEDLPGIHREACVPLPQKVMCSVFRYTNENDLPGLINTWEKMHQYCSQYLLLNTNYYYADACTAENIRTRFAALLSVFEDDMARKNTVTSSADYTFQQLPYSLSQISQWEALLTASQIPELIAQIFSYLDTRTEAGKINATYLKAIRIDVTQMLHTVLKHFQVNAHTLYSNERVEALNAWAPYSVAKTKEYLKYLIVTAGNALTLQTQNTSGISLIKAYIDAHLGEELSRSNLAEIAFLNPDYMARLFKKKIGISIGAYIQQQRIKKAKGLLSRTNDSINEIAQKVGYDNFSYFSHIFRKKVGLTPNEYRNHKHYAQNNQSNQES